MTHIFSAFLRPENSFLRSTSPLSSESNGHPLTFPLQLLIISTILLLYFLFHACTILLFSYGYIMNQYAQLGDKPLNTSNYQTMSLSFNLLQCVTILPEVNSHQIQDFKGK